jgi:3-hydroxymyristoyl/3-hydroxydecanoyl-(acyl carrier protein) dehydratase
VGTAELRQLPAHKKLKIVETLWGDLATDEASFSSPVWPGDELKRTEVELAASRIEIMAWDEAKKALR